MSGGRVELGLGAGWFEDEHKAYGIPFPDGRRFARLEEQLAIVTGLWGTQAGETLHLRRRRTTSSTDSPALPKPAQAEIPGLIGGHGPAVPRARGEVRRRVQHAVPRRRGQRAQFGRVRGPARSGRDPRRWSTPTRSSSPSARTTPRSPAGRRDRPRGGGARKATAWPAPRPRSWTGSAAWRDVGSQRVYLQILDLDDLDHLELISRPGAAVLSLENLHPFAASAFPAFAVPMPAAFMALTLTLYPHGASLVLIFAGELRSSRLHPPG